MNMVVKIPHRKTREMQANKLDFSALRPLLLAALFTLSSNFCSFAEQAQSSLDAAAKPNFTRIQDLDVGKKPLNRPVRQKWAVVVGVSKYRDSRLNSQQAYDKFARHFANYLVDPHGGRFRQDHLRLLTDDEASAQSINNSFGNQWLGKLAGPDDLVLIYIATRAFPTTDGSTYLCSYNCSMDNIYGTCLSIQSLMQDIRKNIKSDRIVLILESSYSGSAELSTLAKPSKANNNVDLDAVSLGKGFIVLSSSRPDQLSWGDLFSQNLTNSLKEKDGLITLEEAFLKAQRQTESDSINKVYNGRKQSPVMKSDWSGNDLVLGCVPIEDKAAIPEFAQNFIGAESHYLNANRAVVNADLDKAISEYKLAIAADPGLTDARADYAVALSMKGQWADAEQELRKAIGIKPDDPLYLSNYARILDKLGSKEESKQALEKAYMLNPKDRVVLLALADKCLATGDRKTAMRMVDQALVLYPKNALALDRMCFLLSLEGRNSEAMTCAKDALESDPELASARLKLGALYVLKGDNESAIKEYRVVISKNDSNADAHYLLAEALSQGADKNSAASEYKRFLELAAPTDSRRSKAESALKAIAP